MEGKLFWLVCDLTCLPKKKKTFDYSNGLSRDGSFTFNKESAKHSLELTAGGALTGTGRISPTTNAVFAPTLFQPIPPPKNAKKSTSGSHKNKLNASYLAPTANTVHNSVNKYAPKEEEQSKVLSASLGAQKNKFRAQLSALYRSKKKAASALHEMHAAKHKGKKVFSQLGERKYFIHVLF